MNGLLLLGTLLMSSLVSPLQSRVPSGANLEGVWRIAETQSDEGGTTTPQPALYIFTKKYYSIVAVTSSSPRQPLKGRASEATAAELLEVFGPAFNAQSGTYEFANGTLVLHPQVAKNPAVMTSNVGIYYQVDRTGPSYALTSRSGQIVRIVLSRLE